MDMSVGVKIVQVGDMLGNAHVCTPCTYKCALQIGIFWCRTLGTTGSLSQPRRLIQRVGVCHTWHDRNGRNEGDIGSNGLERLVFKFLPIADIRHSLGTSLHMVPQNSRFPPSNTRAFMSSLRRTPPYSELGFGSGIPTRHLHCLPTYIHTNIYI